MCQPSQPGTMQYTIVDDDVEAAPIYRCDGKAKTAYMTLQKSWPAYGVSTCMERELIQQQMHSLVVPACGSLESTSKIQGTQKYT